jgi:PhzF family phenazine biosynthesis protein
MLGLRRKVFYDADPELLAYDVFTTDRLAGNPLGRRSGQQGLDTAAMQAIAREFNLSETVFVLPPGNPSTVLASASSRPL